MHCDSLSLAGKIPARIARLEDLAFNFWWSWHRAARNLFKTLDYTLWRSTGHNPVQMLAQVSADRLEELAADPLFRHAPGGDYRLHEESPGVDAGTAQGAPFEDVKGILRPIGPGYDMGAHEFFEFFEAYLPLVARDW